MLNENAIIYFAGEDSRNMKITQKFLKFQIKTINLLLKMSIIYNSEWKNKKCYYFCCVPSVLFSVSLKGQRTLILSEQPLAHVSALFL